MAHTFGKASTRTSSAGNPITTASFTIDPGETVLVLLLDVVGGTNRAGTAPTFNGSTMIQANSTQKAVTSPEASCELWYLLNPTAGTFTATIPNTGALTIFYTLATGVAARGGHSLFDGANGGNATSTNPTPGAVTCTEAGDIGFAITAGGWTTWSPSAQAGTGFGGTDTSLGNFDNGANGSGQQYILQSTPASVTLGWTFATSDDWGAVAVFFKEVSPNSFQNYMRVEAGDGISVTG